MLLGTFFTLLTGLVWTGVGICLTSARRAKCQVEHFYIVGSLCAAAIILLYLLVTGGVVPEHWSWIVALSMVGCAFFNGLSNLCIMVNMGLGNAALYFALSRIGFAFSFLWSVLVWHEQMSVLNAIGMLSLLGAVVLTSVGKGGGSGQSSSLCHKRLLLAIGCSVFSAFSQICIIFPFSAGFDAQPLPPFHKTLILLGTNCVFFGLLLPFRHYPKADLKPLLKSGLTWGILCVFSYACVFAALEHLGNCQRSGIVYPIGCAIQIFLFALYARIAWKEKLTPCQLVAMALIIVGILAVQL